VNVPIPSGANKVPVQTDVEQFDVVDTAVPPAAGCSPIVIDFVAADT